MSYDHDQQRDFEEEAYNRHLLHGSDDDDQQCPDGGRCHHDCTLAECFRVRCCEPLSAAGFANDEWPIRIRLAFGSPTLPDREPSDAEG